MAADMGLSPEILDTDASPPDKCVRKVGYKVSLMECLRGRGGQHKPWTDSIKAMKMVLSDKRHQSEALEKPVLQACLDKLHRAMKIVNQQSLIERLDLISRQLGMMFTPPTSPENHVVLSAEMFKIVILLEGQNGIRDVRVGHQENPTSCEDLVEVLSKGDFDAFISHLRGLLGIYSINGDKKQKTKGYLALSSLESDLNLLAQLQSSINGVANYIHKSPLGILLPRRGGHPMKLIYFVSPYDLLCKRTRSSYPMTVEAITENELGHSVTVCMEPCAVASKLQTMPLMSVRTADGKSLPSFQGVNNINSYSLCATFVLVLPQPVPTTHSVICAIREITGQEVICGPQKPLLSLLMNQSSTGGQVNTDELFVTLPDQNHVYYLNSNEESSCVGQVGSLVTKIPFTHPTSVPNVLNLLRQQLLFNAVIQSLVRPAAKQDLKSSLAFEVTALSLQYLSVMFEHPLHSSMVTVEFDLSDITSAKCRVCSNNQDEEICSDDFVSRAFQRCLSIPVTLRTVIHKVRGQVQKLVPPEPTQTVYVKRQMKWTTKQHTVKNYTCATTVNTSVPHVGTPTNLPNPPPYPSSVDNQAAQLSQLESRKYQLTQGLLSRPLAENQISEEPVDKQPANPLLATLLDAGSPAQVQPVPESPQSIISESPMLSKLLEENTSVATNPFPPPNPRKRLTKRKSSKDIISGKSPKQRLSDSDVLDRTSSASEPNRYGQGIAEKHIDLDSSGGSYDEPVRPSSVNSVSSLGAQSTGSVIDLTDIGESHVKKLENSLDSIMQKESRAGSVTMNYGMNVNSHMGGVPHDLMDMHVGMNDFHNQNPNPIFNDGGGDFHQFPPPWSSRQTPPTPTSRNSPHHGVVPKNEKISTSLEDLLSGPGGREIEGPNSVHGRRNSQQLPRRHSLKRQNSSGRNSVDSATGGLSQDVFSPLMSSPSHHPLASPSNHMTGPFPASSPSSLVSPGSLTSPTNSCGSSPSHPFPLLSHMKNEMMDSKLGILGSQLAPGGLGGRPVHVVSSGGKPSLSALKAQLDMNNDTNAGSNSQEKDWSLKDEAGNHPPLVKLKLSNMRQYDSVSPADSEGNKSRSSTFDFHSDDDEEFALPKVDKITVISSTPTRLQISNKTTLASFNKFNKSEKFKRKEREKELKKALAFDSDKKRKRTRDDSKKEKKRKKLTNTNYSIENDVVYKSTTVHVDDGDENGTYKPMPKLKITKSGVKMSVENNVLQAKDMKPDIKTERSAPKYMKLDKEVVVKVEKVEKTNRRISEKEAVKDIKDVSVLSVKNEKENKDISEIKESDKREDRSPSNVLTRAPTSHNSDEGIFDKINAMKTESLTRVDSEPVNSSTKLSSASETSNSITTSTTSVSSSITSTTSSVSSTSVSSISTSSMSSSSSTTATSSQSSPVSSLVNKKVSSSKSQKSQQKSRSSSTKSMSKIVKQPTIKLKPIVIPSTTSSSSSSSSSKPSPSTPSTPKSIAQSPTSTTIGKIGAVSLATSGSQKQLVPTSNSKSPQGQSAGKTSSTSSKASSSGSLSSLLSSSKSSGNLQKSVQIQGPSGKNSPVPQTSKSGHSRSLSSSSGSSGSSKLEKSSSKSSSSSGRTSSPLLEREKSKSGSSRRESSSGRDRERDKSTSSSKNNVSVTTVITQETAASVLSFLNPKANKISSLPPIPKLSSASGGQKVSTPTSTTSNSIVSTSVTTASSTTSSSSKFNAKTNNTMSNSFNKGPNATFSSNNASSSKSNSSFNKMNNSYSSNSRAQNPAVSNTANMNRTGTNSPVNYPQKGNVNSYNKTNNANSSISSNQGFRNSSSSANSMQSKNSSVASSSSSSVNRPVSSSASTSNSSSKGHNQSNSSQGHRQSNSTSPGNRGSNSNASSNSVPSSSGNSSRPVVSVNNSNNAVSNLRGSNSAPNAPKGPGPPAGSHQQTSHSSASDERGKNASVSGTGFQAAAARGRKGSLSAVIDKLTCKASIPTPGSSSGASAGLSGGVVIDESPASPEPEVATSVRKQEERKVVIFEAPASPEPESSSTDVRGARSIGASSDSIVSIPLDTQSSQDSNTDRQLPCEKKKSEETRDKSDHPQRPNSLCMPSLNSPKIIPLNSPKEKANTPTNKTVNRNFTKQNHSENYQQHNGDLNSEISASSQRTVATERRRSKDRSISPSKKERINSPSHDLSNACTNKPRMVDCDKTKDKVFKVPTPVSVEESERDVIDSSVSGRKRSSSLSEKAISCSPPSSPENGLIIDFPSSPHHNKGSPQCFNDTGSHLDNKNFNKTFNSKDTPVKSKLSPASSPLDNKSGEIPANSPCMLDDDLMDEALGIGN